MQRESELAAQIKVTPRGAWPFLLGVFLVCMSGLMLQIVETRLISVILWYHLAFFAISMAMLGMTVGSLIVYFKADYFPRERLLDNLSWISAALSLSVMLSMSGLITTIAPSGVANTLAMSVFVWARLIAVLLPPYIFAGMAVSLALTRSRWPVGLVYGVDLAGAACGCLFVLALLEWADAISVLIAIAAFAACAAACFALARRQSGEAVTTLAVGWLGRGWRPALLTIAFAAMALANAAVQPTSETRGWRDGLTLLMAKNELEFDQPAVMRWNTFSRVRARYSAVYKPFLWGPSPTMPAIEVPYRNLDIDASAGTPMYQFDGDLSKLDFLRYDLTNLAYTIRNQGRSAVIGVGGGRDLLSAYYFGFRDVTGVELNPILVDLLKGEYRSYNRLVDLPGVQLFVDDGRSWFARTRQKFDLLEMSLVDTWAATGAGAYSLSENGLYTVQAWGHFLDALTPTGVMTVSRWFNPQNVLETGRLISLAAGALRARGVADPEQHIFLAASDHLATLIVGKSALTQDEVAALRARVDQLKFKVMLAPADPASSPALRRILLAQTPAELAAIKAESYVDVSVTTDDRPFFFNQLDLFDPSAIKLALNRGNGVLRGNLQAMATLLTIVALSAVLVLFTIIVPALPALRRTSTGLARVGTPYFLLVGLGFMFVEIGLIQRLSTFLGHPVYGLAVGLFGIILSTGVGSLVSERVPLSSASRIAAWSAVLGAYLVLLPLWFPYLTALYEGETLLVRTLVSLVAIVPSGVLMGFGFPTGMALCNAVDTRPTPWFWAVNGAAGVLAAGVAVCTSIAFSINVSLWIGATCYALIIPVGSALAALSNRTQRLAQAVPERA
jgi:spermidine synthase